MGAESFRHHLRSLLARRGWKLPKLADVSGYSRGYLWEVVTGRKQPSQDLVADLDMALGADGTLIGVWEEGDDVQRRDLLRGLTMTALASPLAADARSAALFARHIADGSIDELTLEQIDADTCHLARRYVSEPLTALIGDLRELRADVFSRLERNRLPSQLRSLHLIASRLCGLNAHLCLDLGFYPEADTHARAALQTAQAAGHHGQYAWARALQALIAFWDGRPNDTIQLSHDGMAYAQDRSTAVRLPALQARAASQLGDPRRALAALAAADDARNGPLPDQDIGGVFSFPDAKQATYAGTTLRDLPGLAERAICESSRALQIYESSAPADRSSGDILAARLDLASSYLASDDLDATAEQLAIVVATAADRRTASIRKRATQLAAELADPRYTNASLGSHLHNELTAFCAPPKTLTAQ